MLPPSEKTLRALINLRGNQDFESVLEWMTDSYKARLDDNTEVGPEMHLRWGQGRAQQLRDFLSTVSNARHLLDLKQKQSNRNT